MLPRRFTAVPRVRLVDSPGSRLGAQPVFWFRRSTGRPLRSPIAVPSRLRCLSSASSPPSSPPNPQKQLVRVTNLPAPNSGHIRILELNRPEARNAISRALLAALRTEIDAVGQQYDAATGQEVPGASAGSGTQNGRELGPTRALIVASAADSCFCSGADLKERRTFTEDETNAFLANLRGTLSALAALPIPTIAAVSSLALGGGLELALAAHMRVLTSNAFVGLPETRLGIIPGAGGTYRLPALIGVARARDLVLTGRRVSAMEAYFLGIADRLVEVEVGVEAELEAAQKAGQRLDTDLLSVARRSALSEAVRLAEEICEGAPVAVRTVLQAVQHPAEVVENELYNRILMTEDRAEALRAFAEKRRPVFTGR